MASATAISRSAARRSALKASPSPTTPSFLSKSVSSTSCTTRSQKSFACCVEVAMFDLKALSSEAVPRALAKAERYRLLNEPGEAESICLDALVADPDNQEAIAILLLALTDQFVGNQRRIS